MLPQDFCATYTRAGSREFLLINRPTRPPARRVTTSSGLLLMANKTQMGRPVRVPTCKVSALGNLEGRNLHDSNNPVDRNDSPQHFLALPMPAVTARLKVKSRLARVQCKKLRSLIWQHRMNEDRTATAIASDAAETAAQSHPTCSHQAAKCRLLQVSYTWWRLPGRSLDLQQDESRACQICHLPTRASSLYSSSRCAESA